MAIDPGKIMLGIKQAFLGCDFKQGEIITDTTVMFSPTGTSGVSPESGSRSEC